MHVRRSAVLAGIALTLASLTACGGGDGGSDDAADDSSYCDVLTDVQAEVSGLDFATLTSDEFDSLLGDIDQLQAAADTAVGEQWAVLGDTLRDLEGSLDDVGLTVEDLPKLEQGQVPNGVDVEELPALTQTLQELLNDPTLNAATEQIRSDAKEQCDIALGESESGGTPSEPTAS